MVKEIQNIGIHWEESPKKSSYKTSIEFFFSKFHGNRREKKTKFEKNKKLEINFQFNVWAYGDTKLIEHKLKPLSSLLIPAKREKTLYFDFSSCSSSFRVGLFFYQNFFHPFQI